MWKAEIFIDKDELKETELLYNFIMRLLLKNGIVGATAFTGFSGFGKHQKLKYPGRPFSFDDTPVLITFVDQENKVKMALKELRKQYKGGFIITHPVTQW